MKEQTVGLSQVEEGEWLLGLARLTASLYLVCWSPYYTLLSNLMTGVESENITRVQSRGDIGEGSQ